MYITNRGQPWAELHSRFQVATLMIDGGSVQPIILSQGWRESRRYYRDVISYAYP